MPAFSRSEVVAALSHALDLTEGQVEGHAGRTCVLGLRMAEDLGVPQADRAALYYALLLKDSGCSSSAARMSQIFGTDDLTLKRTGKLVDWTRPSKALRWVAGSLADAGGLLNARHTLRVALEFARDDVVVDARCERGAKIVADLGFPPSAAETVRCLDEHWDGKGRPRRMSGEEIPLLARIACLSQTAEVFITTLGRPAARRMVRKRRGRWFDPAVADAFLRIPDDDPVWERFDEAHDPLVVAEMEPHGDHEEAHDGHLDRIAEAFAQVIDAKSSYTFNHSTAVAEYAVAVGRALGEPEEGLRRLRRAGLLHDIGKLGVSSAILDKPGRLTDEEYAQIRLHARYTEEILGRISLLAEIAPVAASHHERMDGGGYHRGLRGEAIPEGGRILAVADVFDALTANRPYRDGMSVADALMIMRKDRGTAFWDRALDALCDIAHDLPPRGTASGPARVPRATAA
ncbi:MAG: HD domain-containing phosphohydrolase [Thermoleophilia bacterium]